MSEEYSTYEAKARFSELLRKVRQGKTVTITYHGEPLAELRPIRRIEGTDARIEWLRSKGRISGGDAPSGRMQPVAKKRGALKRFLDEREDSSS